MLRRAVCLFPGRFSDFGCSCQHLNDLLPSGEFFHGKVMIAVNAKQKRFADEYLIDCNATQAAIRAGYSPKTAKQVGQRLLTKVDLSTYIEQQLEQIHNAKTADAMLPNLNEKSVKNGSVLHCSFIALLCCMIKNI